MPAYPIMFFGGKLAERIEGDGEYIPKYEAIAVDEWIVFSCDRATAQLVKVSLLRDGVNLIINVSILVFRY